MVNALYWFGVIHATAYSLVGLAIVIIWAAERVIKKAGIGADMLAAGHSYESAGQADDSLRASLAKLDAKP